MAQRKVKRVAKWVAGTALAAAVTWLLVQPKRSNDIVPEGRVVVRYWEKWSGKEGEDMRAIVDEFNRTVGAEKNIHVSYISMSAVEQKTLISTAAGDPPDVAGLFEAQISQFAAINAIEPLTDLAREHGLTREKFKPVFWDICNYEGQLFVLPSTPAVVGLHYNKLLFAKKATELRAAGLDPDRPPRNIDELDRYAAILDNWDSGKPGEGKLLSAGYMPTEPGWWIAMTPVWFGSEIYDPKTRKLNLLEPQALASFEWLAGYSKRLGVDRMRQFRAGLSTNFDSPQSPFFNGNVAMEQEGTWKANYVSIHAPQLYNVGNFPPDVLARMTREQRRANTGWAVGAVPSSVPGVEDACLATMDMLCIPKTSKHKREAFEFIAFVNRQDIAERLAQKHCKNSAFKQMSAAYIEGHSNPYIETFEKLADSPHAMHLPQVPVWPEISAELTAASDRVILGLQTPRQALEATQARCQPLIDKFYERQSLRKGGAQ